MQNADGYGTSGVCTSELDFYIPAADYVRASPSAEVEFYRLIGETKVTFAPKFYISTRKKTGGKVEFKCLDRMICTEQPCDIPEWAFTDDKIEASYLANYIASRCGLTELWFGGTITDVPAVYLTKDNVIGASCYELLESISAAWCGYFKVNNDGKLLFLPFGSVYDMCDSDRHAAISEGGTKGPILQVIMSNGSEEFISGDTGADFFSTLKISTEYASQELASAIMGRINGYVYEAWECPKCVIDGGSGDIEINAEISFADGTTRVANYITKIPTAGGILVTCGRNDVTENEFDYTGALSRQIKKRIADGELLGNNTMITRYQGLIHLGEKKTEEDGTATQNRYGYSAASAEGVVKYDGAIVDKTLPSVEVTENADEFSITYGETKLNYKLKWNGDNIEKMEELK